MLGKDVHVLLSKAAQKKGRDTYTSRHTMFHSPHPSPLVSQPVRGERSVFLAGLLVAATQLPSLMHFLEHQVQSHVAAQSHPRKFPVFQEDFSFLKKEKTLRVLTSQCPRPD